MAIFDLFSKRTKGRPDTFTYDAIPDQLRVQIVHIWRDAIEKEGHEHLAYDLYKYIHDALCREYGMFELVPGSRRGIPNDLQKFFLSCPENERTLDVIELVFSLIDRYVRSDDYRGHFPPRLDPDDAIDELNARFLEHGIGYLYTSGKIIRKDSELIHSEIVQPVLEFLSDPSYVGANEEYLIAHEHYRHGRNKECLNECLKAFESTMKAVCHKRSWSYSQNDPAKKLIEVCFSNELIPSHLQSQMSSLRSSLESGIPTVRNKLGGHGQGVQVTTVPQHLAHYLLNLTATTILLLIEAEKTLS
jgi:hypothetical protein